MNHEILKERYTEYRIKIKKLPNGSLAKRELKEELSLFLKEVDETFGRSVVDSIIKKKI
jgi:hypothetical protein